jgi:hypothetical protein
MSQHDTDDASLLDVADVIGEENIEAFLNNLSDEQQEDLEDAFLISLMTSTSTPMTPASNSTTPLAGKSAHVSTSN